MMFFSAVRLAKSDGEDSLVCGRMFLMLQGVVPSFGHSDAIAYK